MHMPCLSGHPMPNPEANKTLKSSANEDQPLICMPHGFEIHRTRISNPSHAKEQCYAHPLNLGT